MLIPETVEYLRNLLPELCLHVAWQGNVKLLSSSRGLYTRSSEAPNPNAQTRLILILPRLFKD